MAATVAYNGIVGANGHKANVTIDQQLLTTEASPGSFFYGNDVAITSGGTSYSVVATAPSGKAMIAKDIQIDVFSGSTFGQTQYINLGICDSDDDALLGWSQNVNPAGIGNIDVPLNPGVAVPAGDSLCAYNASSNISVQIMATGYTVPASDVATAAAKAVRHPLTQQR